MKAGEMSTLVTLESADDIEGPWEHEWTGDPGEFLYDNRETITDVDRLCVWEVAAGKLSSHLFGGGAAALFRLRKADG